MNTTSGRALFVALCCAALIACTSHADVVPGRQSGLHPSALQDADNGGGAGGKASPNPKATPNTAAEDDCNTNGGVFVDVIGGTGVSCAGQVDGPTFIQGGVPACGYTYQIGINTAGQRFGYLSSSSGIMAQFGLGAQIDANTCEWNASTT